MTEIIAEFGSSITVDLNSCHKRATKGYSTLDGQKHELDMWCRAASWAGATHAKIQLFKAEHFPIAEQESKRPLEFPRELVPLFVETAHRYGLKAGASVFDVEAVELAARHCDFIKLAAREQYNKELSWMASDFPQKKFTYRSISDWDAWYKFYIPLHGGATFFTIQKYPAGLVESLLGILKASQVFPRFFKARWGYSSHTRGWMDCWLAAKLGASVIEKHIAMRPDDIEAGHSLLPAEFAKMAKAIKGVSK